MRRVVVSNIVSLDGYYEGPGEDVMALNMDAAFDAYNLERIRAASTVLLGRRSFELFSSYWPLIADAPEEPGNQMLSDGNRELSRIYAGIPKVVVSETYAVPEDNPWAGTTTVRTRDDVVGWLDGDGRDGNGEILVFASHRLWTALLHAGAIDELHLMVGPRALGGGTPLFPDAAALRLLDVRRFDGSDNVLLRYEPAR